jgi:hypothetical protein
VVWTLAHRGYSGGGRLDIWVYPTKRAALQAGADLAMASGLEEEPEARRLFADGRFQAVLDRYRGSPLRNLPAAGSGSLPPTRLTRCPTEGRLIMGVARNLLLAELSQPPH